MCKKWLKLLAVQLWQVTKSPVTISDVICTGYQNEHRISFYKIVITNLNFTSLTNDFICCRGLCLQFSNQISLSVIYLETISKLHAERNVWLRNEIRKIYIEFIWWKLQNVMFWFSKQIKSNQIQIDPLLSITIELLLQHI